MQFSLTTFSNRNRTWNYQTVFYYLAILFIFLKKPDEDFAADCGCCIILQTSRWSFEKFAKNFPGLFLWCCVIQAYVITLLDKKKKLKNAGKLSQKLCQIKTRQNGAVKKLSTKMRTRL